MTMTLDPSIEVASRLLGALVFAIAVFGKLRHRDEFFGVVANYRLLPQALTVPAAWVILLMEGFVVVSFVAGVWLMLGALIALSSLLVFTIAMSINIARGRTHIDCGCFQSALEQRLSGGLIARNVVLMIAIAPTLIAALDGASSVTMKLSNAANVMSAIDGFAAGLALFVLYQAFGLLITLRDLSAALQKRVV